MFKIFSIYAIAFSLLIGTNSFAVTVKSDDYKFENKVKSTDLEVTGKAADTDKNAKATVDKKDLSKNKLDEKSVDQKAVSTEKVTKETKENNTVDNNKDIKKTEKITTNTKDSKVILKEEDKVTDGKKVVKDEKTVVTKENNKTLHRPLKNGAYPAKSELEKNDLNKTDLDVNNHPVVLSDDVTEIEKDKVTTINIHPGDVAQNIQNIMAKTYNYNKSLGAERENVKIITENLSESVADWMPVASATYSRGKNEGTSKGPSVATSSIDSYSTAKGVSVRVPVFNGFGSVAKYKREKNNVEASKSRLDAIEQEVLLNTATAYMNVVRERKALDIAKGKEEALNKYYTGTKDRFDLGEVTQTDVSQAYTRLTRAITERIEAEGLYDTSKYVYERLVGEKPYGLFLAVKNPIDGEIQQDALIEKALNNNPSIQVAKFNIEAAGYDIMNKKSALLPTIDITAARTLRDGSNLGVGYKDIDDKNYFLNVSLPLTQGGAEYSRIRRAKRTEDKLKFDLEEQKNLTKASLIAAINDYNVVKSSIPVNEASVKTALIALQGLKHEVEVGVRTTVDLLDAEQEYSQAQTLLLRSKRDLIVNAYKVLELSGDLTARKYNIGVQIQNPNDYYQEIKYKVIGY